MSRDIFAYDRLGFGHSSRRDELLSDQFVWEKADTYFPKIKQQLQIKNYVLFGHSVGGSISIDIAAKDVDCVGVVTESDKHLLKN